MLASFQRQPSFFLFKHSFFVFFPHVPVQKETIAAFQSATIGEEGGEEREDGREDGEEQDKKENRLK